MDDFPRFLKKIKGDEGLRFIKKLLDYEKKRFDRYFLKGSVYEQINEDFGIFPKEKVYPVYFSGDISKPEAKYVFVGINPGFDIGINISFDSKQTAMWKSEREFLERRGLFEGYKNIFKEFFPTTATRTRTKKGLIKYYAHICSFLRKYQSERKVDNTWEWLHKNVIALELIPYHSSGTGGLTVNNEVKYERTYFQILIKMLDYLNPKNHVFFNGFSGFENHFKKFKECTNLKKKNNIWTGKIITARRRIDFIGLPFLNRVKGGKDQLVNNIKKALREK